MCEINYFLFELYNKHLTCHKSVHACPMTSCVHHLPVVLLAENGWSLPLHFPFLALLIVGVDCLINIMRLGARFPCFAVSVVLWKSLQYY